MKILKRSLLFATVSALAVIGGAVLAQDTATKQDPAKKPADAKPAPQDPAARPRPNRANQLRLALPMMPPALLQGYLGLNKEQVDKITPIHEKAEKAIKDVPAVTAAQRSDPEARKKLQEQMKQFSESISQAQKDVEAVLTEDQRKKIPQMLEEVQTLNSVGIPMETVGDLKLTEEQRKKLTEIGADAQKERQALSPEDRRAKGREIQQKAREKANAVLTAEQKAAIEKYMKDNPRTRRVRPAPADTAAPKPPTAL